MRRRLARGRETEGEGGRESRRDRDRGGGRKENVGDDRRKGNLWFALKADTACSLINVEKKKKQSPGHVPPGATGFPNRYPTEANSNNMQSLVNYIPLPVNVGNVLLQQQQQHNVRVLVVKFLTPPPAYPKH